jgi:hypothetical protein
LPAAQYRQRSTDWLVPLLLLLHLHLPLHLLHLLLLPGTIPGQWSQRAGCGARP